MSGILDDSIKGVLERIAGNDEDELMKKSQSQLEDYWFFKGYDSAKSMAINMYEFYDMLGLYGRYCERWENKKNGPVCIVERVRDKYLMPKIGEFVEEMQKSLLAAGSGGEPEWWPQNPYPAKIFPMTEDEYVKAVPDGKLRSDISGFLGREMHDLASKYILQAVRDNLLPG